jgi:hypothetical protein
VAEVLRLSEKILRETSFVARVREALRGPFVEGKLNATELDRAKSILAPA